MLGIEEKIAKAYQRTRAFATSVPGAYLKAAAAVKTGLNIATRLGIDTASEMMQEGIQARTSLANSDYDVQHNRDLSDRIFEDLMHGYDAAYIWINQNSPEMRSEAETFSQMNATPLLTLFGPGSAQVFTNTANGIRQWKMIDAIQHNIDAQRRGDIATLEQAFQYAKMSTPEDREQMRKHFADFKRIAGSHEDAQRKINPDLSDEQLMSEDDKFISSQLIDEQEKDFEDIYALAHSDHTRVIAARANAKEGSDKFAKVVSLLNFRRKKRAEAFTRLQQLDSEQQAALGQNAIEDYIKAQVEREVAKGNFEEDFISATNANSELQGEVENRLQKNQTAKMLVHAATLMEIIEDYSQLQSLSKNDDVFLSRSKSKLAEVKKALKQNGFDVETKDDVLKL